MNASEVSPFARALTLDKDGVLVVDHLVYFSVGEVVYFQKLPPNRIQSFRCDLTEEGNAAIRRALLHLKEFKAAAMSDRISLSLQAPGSVLTIIVPESMPHVYQEMKTGKRVKIQWRDPRDFGEPAMTPHSDLSDTGFQLDVVFEDGTMSPYSFSCNLFDFVEHGTKSPVFFLPRNTLLRRALVRCGELEFGLPAHTDMSIEETDGGYMVSSNSILVNLKAR
jgi:hypothetical protein